MPKRKKAEDESDKSLVNGVEEPHSPPSKRRKAQKVKEEVLAEEVVVHTQKVTKKRKSQAVETVKKEDSESDTDPAQKTKKKVVRKRKTAEEKQAEAMPLAARTVGHKLYIGAHVSGAGGVHNAVLNSHHIGANAFALFLKSQRKWANPPLLDDVCTSFHSNCGSHTYDQAKYVVPHGSYLVNLAHTDKTRTEQAYDSFLDDLKRCERLGIVYYNFHPGTNSSGVDRPTAIRHLASNINRAHKETSSVITLLENMAHGGNVLGSTFEDLRDIIALINDKSRVGVCLDTCHAFAGGYDLRTPFAFNDTMSKFQELVGTGYLRAVHMNDSKAPFASHKDLHANIGTGFLGLRAFHNIVNDPRFEGLPLILETPIEAKDDDGVLLKDEKGKEKEDKGVWAREIKLLESLVGMDTESEEFLGLEAQLARKGRKERERIEDQMERKREKDAAKADRMAKKGQKGVGKKKKKADESEESELSELDDGAESE